MMEVTTGKEVSWRSKGTGSKVAVMMMMMLDGDFSAREVVLQ